MRYLILLVMVFLAGCTNNKGETKSGFKTFLEAMDSGLQAQPDYARSSLQRQQIEAARLYNERMQLENEAMKRQLANQK